MTTTTTKYKREKKGKQKKKKKVVHNLQGLRYKINYITYNTTESHLFTQHYLLYISFLTIILPTNLTLQYFDFFSLTVVLPDFTYSVTF